MPQSSEAKLNRAKPPENTRRRPRRSPSEPKVSNAEASISAYASTTHCRLERSASRSRWIWGSATFTTVTSRRSMNVATEASRSVSHLRCTAAEPTGSQPPALDGEVPELLADAAIEARTLQLGEAADAVAEVDPHPSAGLERSDRSPVDGDVDGVTAGRVAHLEDVARRHDE